MRQHPSLPSDDLPSNRAATSSGRDTTSNGGPQHELTGVQDERLIANRLDLTGELGLLQRRVDVG
jgi:hypothetical protein